MADHPSGYLWSSYAINAGMRSDPLIRPHIEFLALALDAEARHAAYRALFDQEVDERLQQSIRDATRVRRGKPGPRIEERRAAYAVG